MICHSKKTSDTFGHIALSTINKEKKEKTSVRNTVRNRPKPSETKNPFRTLSDTCPKSNRFVTLINTQFVRLSETSDHFEGGVKMLAKKFSALRSYIINVLKEREKLRAEAASFFKS